MGSQHHRGREAPGCAAGRAPEGVGGLQSEHKALRTGAAGRAPLGEVEGRCRSSALRPFEAPRWWDGAHGPRRVPSFARSSALLLCCRWTLADTPANSSSPAPRTPCDGPSPCIRPELGWTNRNRTEDDDRQGHRHHARRNTWDGGSVLARWDCRARSPVRAPTCAWLGHSWPAVSAERWGCSTVARAGEGRQVCGQASLGVSQLPAGKGHAASVSGESCGDTAPLSSAGHLSQDRRQGERRPRSPKAA